VLAEDLLSVLRIEYGKARDGTHNGGQAGVYQPGYGTYAPQQQQQQQQQQPAGQDAYAAYYGVSAVLRFSGLAVLPVPFGRI
jgi:hypothetical protein